MKKDFARFIEATHHYPDHFQESQLEAFLEPSDVKLLKDLSLLRHGGDLKEIMCESCDDDHFLEVREDGGRLYCYCADSDITRTYLDSAKVATWDFDVEVFLRQMALELDIDEEVERLDVRGLWQVGGFSRDDTRHQCYYYQGKNNNEALAFIKERPSQMRRYILFVNRYESCPDLGSDHILLQIEMKMLASLKNGKLVFEKKIFDQYLIRGFRNVIFDEKNGDLIVNGKVIATITPSTPEHSFASILWKNFNVPVSHKKIENFIYQKKKREYADLAGKLCHKQKDKIKGLSGAPEIIDKIFKSTKDAEGENAYIMRNIE